MVESFENLGTILRNWAKGKVQKILVEALNRYEKQREKKIKPFPFYKMTQKNTRALSVGSRGRLNQAQNWSW